MARLSNTTLAQAGTAPQYRTPNSLGAVMGGVQQGMNLYEQGAQIKLREQQRMNAEQRRVIMEGQQADAENARRQQDRLEEFETRVFQEMDNRGIDMSTDEGLAEAQQVFMEYARGEYRDVPGLLQQTMAMSKAVHEGKIQKDAIRQAAEDRKLELQLKGIQIRTAQTNADTALLKQEQGGKDPANYQKGGLAILDDGTKVMASFDPNTGGYVDSNTGQPLPEGAIVTPTSVTTDKLSDLSSKDSSKLKEAQVATRTFISTGKDAIEMVDQYPDINTMVAKGSALYNNVMQEAKAIERAIGAEEDNALDPATYDNAFNELGIQSDRMRGLITSLAFQAAAASGQVGKSVSNKDIERFIQEIGGSSADPEAFKATLTDVMNRTDRNYRTRHKVYAGEEYTEDLGANDLLENRGKLSSQEEEELVRLRKKYGKQ